MVAHTLSFPDLFGPGSLVGGAQTTVWLWLAWHTAFPLAVLGYALLVGGRRDAGPAAAGARNTAARRGTGAAVLAPLALAGACVLLATAGHDRLPALLDGGRYIPGVTRPVLAVPLAAALLALAVLAARTGLRRALDLWLGVALGAWAVEIRLSALLNSGRFQAGFYVGRLYGLLASCTVLISLLLAAAALHGRLARALARERTAADAALAASEARYRALTEAAAHLTWAMRPDGSLSFASRRFRDYTGLEAAEITAADWGALLHPEDRGHGEAEIARALAQGEAFEVSLRLRRRDGAWRWILGRAEPLRDAQGRAVEWVGTILDVHDRREAEAAVAESEARFRAMADNIPQLAWMARPDGSIFWYNRRWFDTTGTTPDAMEGWGWRAVHHPDHLARVEERFRRAVAAGEPWEDTFPLRVADGGWRWFLSRALPVRDGPDADDPDGRVRLWFGTNTDVTERREAEAALRASEARLRAAIALAPLPILLHAEDGEILQASEAWQEISGWRWPEDIPTVADWVERAYGTRGEALRADIGRLYALDRRADGGDHEIRTAAGGVRIWSFGSAPLGRDARGRRLVVSMAADVTDLRRAEERRGAAERLLRDVVDGAADPIFVKDREGRFLLANRRTAEIFGAPSPEAVQGRRDRDFLPPAVAERIEALDRGVMARGETVLAEEAVPEDGVMRTFLSAKTPLRDAEGRVAGVIGIARDITDRKRAEAALRDLAATLEARVEERTARLAEVAAELDAFAYTVSHDLRAPLRAMEGFARILEEDHAAALDAAGRRHARRIVEAAERMDGLIQDLLAYSRLSRAEIEARPVALEEAVDRAVADLPPGAAEVEAARPLPAVRATRPVLGLILANLLSNAAKFRRPGAAGPARIRIRAEARPGGRVRLWVEDDGIGVAPEHLERIFEVFQRLHGQESYQGTGIGLAIVRKAAERLGGAAGAESGGPGRGSRFWVELPGAETDKVAG